MDLTHAYSRQRRVFGRPCQFEDWGPKKLVDIRPEPSLTEQFLNKTHMDLGMQAIQHMTEHQVNTARIEFANAGMNHTEGGWPKDIEPDNLDQTIRYRKKIEKDEGYLACLLQLGIAMENCLSLNNAMDVYQQFFEEEVEEIHEVPSAKTMNVFRDPHKLKRAVTGLSWHPDKGRKLAAAYSSVNLKQTTEMSTDSYIWDIEKPVSPEMVLKPQSALFCLEYNPKDSYSLMGGCYNGQVAFWDTRRGSQIVDYSSMEHSHKDPVYKVTWVQSKTGTEAFSTSTDGQVLWWDVRKLKEPMESLILDLEKEGNLDRAMRAISLEFEVTMPTKFMVGTEQGLVIACNRKAKTPAEKIVCTFDGRHGAIGGLMRNPSLPKNFISVGDLCTRIWCEDIKESSIMHTGYDMANLMDACWSPIRPSVFFVIKRDGVLDIWDLLFKHNDPSLSVKVCDSALYSIRVQERGFMVACGSEKGEALLLEMCPMLATLQKNEKGLVAALFEREQKREKVLMTRQREMRMKEMVKAEQNKEEEGGKEEGELSTEELVVEAEKDFFSILEGELKRRATGKNVLQKKPSLMKKDSTEQRQPTQ